MTATGSGGGNAPDGPRRQTTDAALRQVGDGEEALIQRYFAPLAAGAPGALGLADDCALLTPAAGCEFVVTTDAVAAGVHFFPDDPPADIGWKALAVNVSDLAAKGARPVAYLLAIAMPEAPVPVWLESFAVGLGEAQAAFGCRLVGGDTDRRPGPLSITITAIGEVPAGTMVRRAAARNGDRLYVTGTLGDAALGLMLRQTPALGQAWSLDSAEARGLVTRYLRPQPRLMPEALRRYASAAMDISDGLAKDLGRMVRASGVAAEVEVSRLPMSRTAARVVECVPALIDRVVASGDDYEILAAVPVDKAAGFEVASAAAGVTVTRIGHVTDGSGLVLRNASGQPMQLARAGWDRLLTRLGIIAFGCNLTTRWPTWGRNGFAATQ